MKRPIENNSSPGQVIYEPFSGSGTTIIAAEMTGRACYAVELAPSYVDVAVTRWQAFTGKRAFHASTGLAFSVAKPIAPRKKLPRIANHARSQAHTDLFETSEWQSRQATVES
jgi:hypothetical protein